MVTVKEHLAAKKVSELPNVKGEVIEVDSKASLESAFSSLVDNNILSAPVWDEASKKYLGLLDVRDVVAFAVFATKENKLAKSLGEILNHGAKMHAKAQDNITVSYLCRRNPIKSVTPDSSLLDVCKILTTGTHRVPIMGESGKITNIISQSSIIAFIVAHLTDDPLMQQTVEGLKLGSSPVVTVNEHQTALVAFSKLDDTGRSGIAVVDNEGVLVGNTSGSDIKLYLKNQETLEQPIIEFLHKIRRLDLTTRAPTFTCKPDDSLVKVMGKLGATKAHRVFEVDDHHKVLRVVSLTDILRVILKA